MSNEVGWLKMRLPLCTKCNRVVDTVGYDLDINSVASWSGWVHTYYTGLVTIYVECHGERWEVQEYYQEPYPWVP